MPSPPPMWQGVVCFLQIWGFSKTYTELRNCDNNDNRRHDSSTGVANPLRAAQMSARFGITNQTEHRDAKTSSDTSYG